MKQFLILALVSLSLVAPARADDHRYVVDTQHGNDSAACTLEAPCKTIKGALRHTPNGRGVLIVDGKVRPCIVANVCK